MDKQPIAIQTLYADLVEKAWTGSTAVLTERGGSAYPLKLLIPILGGLLTSRASGACPVFKVRVPGIFRTNGSNQVRSALGAKPDASEIFSNCRL